MTRISLLTVAAVIGALIPTQAASPEWITLSGGKLVYGADTQGNRVPDFSQVGYRAGEAAPPQMPVANTVSAGTGGDDTARIQQALDKVAATGKPGAVLLAAGTYHLAGTVRIAASGVVLRGAGTTTNLVGTGAAHTLVELGGTGSRSQIGTAQAVTDSYVPVGARILHVADGSGFHAGDHVIVQRPQEKNWIHAIGMDAIPPRPDGTPSTQWTPNTGLLADRTITVVSGNTLTVDVPLTNALESQYTHATVWRYGFAGRITGAGVEHLAGNGAAFEQDPKWHDGGYFASALVGVGAAQDSWVRDVTATRFGSAFGVGENALRVSVLDTAALDVSVPQDISAQPVEYTISGQQTLIDGCRSTGSNFHAWATQARVPGPNVVVHCSATNTGSRKLDAGPHQRWATGTLYDSVSLSGNGYLELQDRQWMGSGQGWAGANSVLWNCAVGTAHVENPPTAHNWAFGCTGKVDPPTAGHQQGEIVSPGTHLVPASLYEQQLAERLHS
ncbi:hypothetical protein KALB_3770 [Kutzneria albida DSM 43870]|uniref:Uncharacterized protein n=1 Tax=Kutzneria albida DSM 43870 TaxID=1449976 RepID=W5WG62_9PSEU|nr:hypothetical protein KALB_3770 [Kutzneria albida DSM 43870]